MGDGRIGQTPTTNFYYDAPKVIKDILAQRPKEDPLKYYQRIIHDWVIKRRQRGILCDFGLGTGKSIVVSALSHSLSEQHPDYKVLFISNKSLHKNMVNNLKKYLEMIKVTDTDTVLQRYRFISLNASNMMDQVMRTQQVEEAVTSSDLYKLGIDIEESEDLENINNSIVCVDEAHEFFNAIANGSKNALALYDKIMAAKEIYVLFFTGTPIINSPYEMAIAFNMCRGPLDSSGTTLFPEDYELFMQTFCDMGSAAEDPDSNPLARSKVQLPSIRNRSKYQDRVTGLCSYYGLGTAEGKDADDLRKLFPTQNETFIVRVPMSELQWTTYAAARERELFESKRAKIRVQARSIHKPKGSSSSYRVRSRQAGLFIYPKEAIVVEDHGTYQRMIKHPDRIPKHCFVVNWNDKTGLDSITPKSKKLGKDKSSGKAGGKEKSKEKSSSAPEKQLPKSETSLIDHGPKIIVALSYIANHLPWITSLKPFRDYSKHLPQPTGPIVPGPGIVYSEFVENLAYPFARVLEEIGFERWTPDSKKTTAPRFAVMSGEVEIEVRDAMVQAISDPKNQDGEILSMIILTKTGATGIDTKGCTWAVAMETHWHAVRLQQLWKRINRLNSHAHLPKSRQFVQPYLLLADYPKSESNELATIEEPTDLYMYLKAIQNRHLNDEFLTAHREVSLDCLAHHPSGKTIACRQCAPTGQPLYTRDMLSDLTMPEKCQPLQVSHIQVTVIEVDGVQYAYRFESGLHIFVFRDHLGAYQEIPPGTPTYSRIASIIKNK